MVLALGLVVPAGVREARGGDVRTVKDRPYPEKFRRRVGDGIARALEHLHEQTQRPLWIHGGDARFRWSADVLWAFEREGRGLELQADEEIRARLRGRVPATVEEASRLILALCARPLPDGNPFSKRPPPRPALAEQDRGAVLRAVRLLLGAQVMRATLPPGAEKDPPEDVLRGEDRGGWSELETLDGQNPTMADVPGTGNALLALEAAVHAGAPVPPERFLAALELLLRWQAPSGQATRLHLEVVGGDRRHAWSQMARARGWGWTGSRGDKPEGDATASGVLGLAVCKGALQGHASLTPVLRAQTDEGIYDTLAWLQEHFSVRRNPDPRGAAPSGLEAQSRCLWLLRLVQVGEHLRLRQVGRCDWYREGAEALLKEQQDDGAWKKPVLRPIDPLLLLLRAGPVPSTVVLTPPQEGGD